MERKPLALESPPTAVAPSLEVCARYPSAVLCTPLALAPLPMALAYGVPASAPPPTAVAPTPDACVACSRWPTTKPLAS
ncbi:hypothetical protein BIY41_18105 [Xanthomonas citri pv. glycines]|uniref:Uncharacterized protein n=1 Tax=Xanthomonas campestris pv. glycines TaxID=473421 RepID=A0AAX0HYT0_XANCG|nr:hypothetical protein BIY41_18105 [Xanthomonas citri pv. glycines]